MSSSGSSRAYSAAQESSAAQIVLLSRFNLYDVLELDSSASQIDISRAYKKQALRLHPDKNSAPSAEDAMRAVNLAFEELSDPMKRDWFDTHGFAGRGSASCAPDASPQVTLQQQQQQQQQQQPQEQQQAKGVEGLDQQLAEFSNSQDFREFISSIDRSEKSQAPRQKQQQRYSTDKLYLVLLLVLTLFYVFAVLSTGVNPSRKRHQSFSFAVNNDSISQVQHFTHGPRVAFYTDKAFDATLYPLYSAQRKRIEVEVEMQYRSLLLQQCVDQRVATAVEGGKREQAGGDSMPEACIRLELLFQQQQQQQ